MQDMPCTYRISVKALIKDDKARILLIREADGKWELPGGGLEHGENPREGLKREISEETGFLVDEVAGRPHAFWTIYKEVGSPTLKWFGFVAYEVKISGTFRPDADGEAEVARYFSYEEAAGLPLHDNTAPYFQK